MAPRLKERYDAEIRERLQEELGLDNVMQVPRLTKIVVNMGDAAAPWPEGLAGDLLASSDATRSAIGGSLAGPEAVVLRVV